MKKKDAYSTRTGGLWAALLLLPPLLGWAQVSIEPLRRAEEPPGQYTWHLSLGYTPLGREGLGVDELGQPYAYTLFAQEWRLTFGGTVQLATGLKTGVEVSEQTTVTQEVQRYSTEEVRLTKTDRTVLYSTFCEYRMDPGSRWDPRASLFLGHPGKAGVGLSLSLLRDPMVLVADLSFRGQEEEPQGWFVTSLGAGFVANLWISVSTLTSLAVPVVGVGVPSTSLGVRVRYGLDVQGKEEIGVRATLVLRGDRTWLALEAEWLGRGP